MFGSALVGSLELAMAFPADIPKLLDGLAWYVYRNIQALIDLVSVICVLHSMSGVTARNS